MRLLTKSDWRFEQERSIEEIFAETLSNFSSSSNVIEMASRFGPSTLTSLQKTELEFVKKLIGASCATNPQELRRNHECRIRGLLLGAWIDLNYGWHGMVYACEFDEERVPGMMRSLEILWHEIGDWLM